MLAKYVPDDIKYIFTKFYRHISTNNEGNRKGVGMIRAEISLKNRQIINETYSFRCFLIL